MKRILTSTVVTVLAVGGYFTFASNEASASLPTPSDVTLSALKSIITAEASAMGDPSATVDYAVTTIGASNAAIGQSPDSPEGSGMPVYMLVAHGNFVGNTLHRPPWAHPLHGTVLVLTVRASDLRQATRALSNNEVDQTQTGPLQAFS